MQQLQCSSNVKCVHIRTVTAREILWWNKIKYLGIDLITSSHDDKKYLSSANNSTQPSVHDGIINLFVIIIIIINLFIQICIK